MKIHFIGIGGIGMSALARFYLKKGELPEIKESINLNLKVKKIDIMESELKKGGAQYTILKSFNL